MRSRWQNLIFFILSTTVIVGGGIIALMAARGTLVTSGGLTQTGTLRLNINPDANIQVFLNEQQKQVSNNKTIESIVPGEYTLRIQKEGFNSWQQQVEVKAGLVTDISVQLFPGKLPPEQVTTAGIQKFSMGNSRRYVYYTVLETGIGSNIGIWQQNLQPSNIPLVQERPTKITNITNDIANFIKQNQYELLPSPSDSRLILKVPTGIYLLDANRYNEPSATNTLSFGFNMETLEWLTDTNLLIRTGELLLDYDVEKKLTTVISYQAGSQPIYTKAGGTVFFINAGKLQRYNPGSITQVKLENVTLPANITKLFSGNSDSSLIIQADNHLYYLDITTSSLTDIGKYQLLAVAPSGRDLMVKDGNQVLSIEINVSLVRSVVDIIRRPTQIGSDINANSIRWAPNSVFLVYTDAANTKLMAADKNGGSLSELIKLAANTNSLVYIASDNVSIVMQLVDSSQDSSRSNIYRLDLRGTAK
jgi:hypothetical protein